MIEPYVTNLNQRLIPGCTIRILGNILPNATRFAINLQCGPNICPRDDIALHLAADFRRYCVVRNSILQNNWGPEENIGPFPFEKNTEFEITIICEEDDFKILINGSEFAKFIHRIPFSRITHLAMDGDVTLKSVNFSSSGPEYGFNFNNVTPAPYPSAINAVNSFGPPYPQNQPHRSGNPYPMAPYPTIPPNAPTVHQPYPVGPQAGYTVQPQGVYPVPPQGIYSGQQSHNMYPNQPGVPPGVATGKSGKTGLLDKAGLTLAGVMSGAGALGAVVHGKKGLKSHKKAQKKALKYGLPIAGVGLGAYALKKGFHRSSSSSSSSSD